MYLFKTSGATLGSVVTNERHAFANQPVDWHPGEWVLVSKNRADCHHGERQIQFLMVLESIRLLRQGEAELYWPGNEGRWRYLVSCRETQRLRPFNLDQVIGRSASRYAAVQAYSRFAPEDEVRLVEFMTSRGLGSALRPVGAPPRHQAPPSYNAAQSEKHPPA